VGCPVHSWQPILFSIFKAAQFMSLNLPERANRVGTINKVSDSAARSVNHIFASLIQENQMKRYMFVVVALTGCLTASAAFADDVTLDSVPAVVAKSVPEAGASDVDPKTSEIKVTFSKDMMDGTWSWATQSKESFPNVVGKPKYLSDKRTCVLTVKLEADKTYAIWINHENFGNFKDTDGQSSLPYLLVFKTKK
jgi:hypothetical protein